MCNFNVRMFHLLQANRVIQSIVERTHLFKCTNKATAKESLHSIDGHPLNILFELNDVYLVWIRQISEWTADCTYEGCLFWALPYKKKRKLREREWNGMEWMNEWMCSVFRHCLWECLFWLTVCWKFFTLTHHHKWFIVSVNWNSPWVQISNDLNYTDTCSSVFLDHVYFWFLFHCTFHCNALYSHDYSRRPPIYMHVRVNVSVLARARAQCFNSKSYCILVGGRGRHHRRHHHHHHRCRLFSSHSIMVLLIQTSSFACVIVRIAFALTASHRLLWKVFMALPNMNLIRNRNAHNMWFFITYGTRFPDFRCG